MHETTYYRHLQSPIGMLLLTSDGQALTGLHMLDEAEFQRFQPGQGWKRDDAPFSIVRNQLDAYFDGGRTIFALPMRLEGTRFQRIVWEELCKIPYGRSISYVELARRIGQPTASRAVGGANGKNPIAVIVPCHRVIAANGTLGGYGGGLDRKRWLLEHEAEGIDRHASKARISTA